MISVFVFTLPAKAETVSPTVAQAAAESTPIVVDTAREVVKIAGSTLKIINLPLGVAEMALSPLPGLTLAQGFKRVKTGLLVPFKLLGAALRLPVNALQGVAGRLFTLDERSFKPDIYAS